MAFSHGPRIVELLAGGSAYPVPVWPDTSAPVVLVPEAGQVLENEGYTILLHAMEAVTFTIRPGADGAAFTLAGDALTLPAQDYEAGKTLFTCNLRATDAAGNATDFTHRVSIVDVLDAPVGYAFVTTGNGAGFITTNGGTNRVTVKVN